jgi:hypothetical protein
LHAGNIFTATNWRTLLLQLPLPLLLLTAPLLASAAAAL